MATKPTSNGYKTNQDATAILIETAQMRERIRSIVQQARKRPLTVEEMLLTMLEVDNRAAEITVLAHDIYERSRRG